MKKYLLFLAVLFSTVTFGQTTTTYQGNGKSNFGGAVGLGSISITEQPDSLSFALTKGPGVFDSLIVFYVDDPSRSGGISSTAVLAGSTSNLYLAAAAGHDPSTGGRAVLNFPGDFQPDGAIVFDKDSGRVFGFLTLPLIGTLIVPRDSFLVHRTDINYTIGASKATLGLTGPLNFKFLGTYIGKSASRSDEAFGDPFTNYQRPAGTQSYNTYNVTSYFTFPSSVLPVKLTDFRAVQNGNVVNISWSVAEEIDLDKYELQRSVDGISFSTVASFQGKNSSVSASYNFKDESAQNGINYYRLITVERGRSEISKIVSVNIRSLKENFIANYLGSKKINLTMNGIKAGAYKLRILNNSGQLIQAQNLKLDGRYQNMQVQLNQNIAKGVYRVTLQSEANKFIAAIFVQ